MTPAATDCGNLFFEGSEPIGEIEAGAGRLLGEASDLLFESSDCSAVVSIGGGNCRSYECSHAIDCQRAREPLAEAFSNAGKNHAVLIAKFLEARKVRVGSLGGAFGQ